MRYNYSSLNYWFDAIKTPYTFLTPDSFRILAQAFAVDPVDMMSSTSITVSGRDFQFLILKAWSLFCIRFTFESFDCLWVKFACRGFSYGILNLSDNLITRKSIWLNHRIIYRLQCIGTATIRRLLLLFSTYFSTTFANISTYSHAYCRSDRYLYASIESRTSA